MSKFLTFRKLESLEEARAIQQLLTSHNIANELEEERALLGAPLIGQQFEFPYRVKIPADAFNMAEKLVRESVDLNLHSIEKDYYLFSFSNEELMEVLEKKDEWGNYDYALAQHILGERGIKITQADLQELDKQRIQSLAEPQNGDSIWTLIGYLSAFLGGLMGLFIGILMLRTKKTLPDGSQVYTFGSIARKHGKYILVTGILAISFWIVSVVFFGLTLSKLLMLLGVFSFIDVRF